MGKLQVWFDPLSNYYRVYLDGKELPEMLGVTVKDQFTTHEKGSPTITFDAFCEVVNECPVENDLSSKCGKR